LKKKVGGWMHGWISNSGKNSGEDKVPTADIMISSRSASTYVYIEPLKRKMTIGERFVTEKNRRPQKAWHGIDCH